MNGEVSSGASHHHHHHHRHQSAKIEAKARRQQQQQYQQAQHQPYRNQLIWFCIFTVSVLCYMCVCILIIAKTVAREKPESIL